MKTQDVVVITFYKFVHLPDFREMRHPLQDFCRANGVFGTILLAEEGINSTIAGPRDGIDAVLAYLQRDQRLRELTIKESYAYFMPFPRMKVRLKQEIVRLKVAGIDPNRCVGTYVEPDEWNRLISDPDVLVIDTRNAFEVELGTFKGALNPQTESFHEFPDFVAQHLDPAQHKKIAMFCTGGIRCEKATAYLLQQGFQEVYHLNGGILRYLEVVDPQESLWDGECFVFDHRVTIDHQLAPGKAVYCAQCRAGVVADASQPCPACGHINAQPPSTPHP